MAALIEKHATKIAACWVAISLGLTVVSHRVLFHRFYTYEHAWIDAIFATMARAFVTHGVIPLHGIPIENNPPLGLQPDAYLHWPPLFPIVLSWAFRLFGESEATAHAVMLVNFLLLVFAVGWIVNRVAGTTAALLAAGFMMVCPVNAAWGAQVISQSAALMLIAVCVALLLSRRAGFRTGIVCLVTALAVATSWEAGLLPVGVAAGAIIVKDRMMLRTAVLMFASAIASLSAILLWYVAHYPYLGEDLWQTILYRAGLAPYHAPTLVHTIVSHIYGEGYSGHASTGRRLLQVLSSTSLVGDIGQIALLAIPFAVARRRQLGFSDSAVVAVCALAAPWMMWFVLMPNHIFHPQMMMFAVPAAAVAFGWGMERLLTVAPAMIVIVPLVLLVPFAEGVWERVTNYAITDDVLFANELRQVVPPNAVIMVPDDSAVPVYYSRRHLIRGITTPALVEQVAALLPKIFPGSPVYAAIEPQRSAAFDSLAVRYGPPMRLRHLVLYQIDVQVVKDSMTAAIPLRTRAAAPRGRASPGV